MEIRQLRYFLAIAEEEHFGRAAVRLHVAQPALTRQIHNLEEKLQVKLFDRLPRGVRLSAAGRALQEDARRLLADVDQITRHVQLVGSGKIGVLRLAYVEVSGWKGIVPDSVREFTEAAHDVHVELTAMASVAQLTAIRERKLDAGFFYNAPKDDPDLQVQTLIRHGVCLAVPDNAPIAARNSLRLEELAGEPLILFQRSGSPVFHDALQDEFRRHQFEPRVVHQAVNEAAMLTLVIAGAGYAIVNASHRWRPPHGMRLLNLEDVTITLELCLVHLRDNRSPTLLRFKDIIDSIVE